MWEPYVSVQNCVPFHLVDVDISLDKCKLNAARLAKSVCSVSDS